MKLITGRESSFVNNSDMQVKVCQKNHHEEMHVINKHNEAKHAQ